MTAGIDNTPEKQALKRACGALIKAVGGLEAAEGYSRPGFRRLSEYQRPDNDCFMPVDAVMDLEAVAHGTVGYPQVTRFLAARDGFALVALPASDAGCGDVHRALAEASKEHGELMTGCLADLGDGQISQAEAERRMACALEAAEAAMRVHAILAQIAEGG